MTVSEKSAFIAECEANARPDNEIDTSEIPEITNFGGFWRRQDHDKCAPIAAHYYRSGYSDGHAAAIKEVQDALAALIASQKQGKKSDMQSNKTPALV